MPQERSDVTIDLSGYADAVDNALAEGKFAVVATVDANGMPDLGFKGSLMVFDTDHLAYWERTRGRHLDNLRQSPGVAVMYFNRDRGMYLRMYGQAELHEDDALRQQIMERTVQPELNYDPERKGIGVLIRVDALEEPFSGTSQRRE
jgi:general stress protein 26